LRLDHTTFQARALRSAERHRIACGTLSQCSNVSSHRVHCCKPHAAVQRTPSAPLWSFGLQLSAQCLLRFRLLCGGTLAAHGWDRLTSASKSRCRCLSNCNGTQQLSALSRSSAARPTHPTPPHTVGDCRTACPAAHCSPNRNDPRGDIAAPGAERTCSVSRVGE
jgi:hypothetical protein